jgi:hypothetical protein
MQVDYQNNTIIKPQGKRTSATSIPFNELHKFIEIYNEVVDVKSPAAATTSWVTKGYPEEETIHVLYSVIVLFGGGHRIWEKFHRLYSSSIGDINSLLIQAHQRRNDNADSLRKILGKIKGLGGLSYSTKMLRFLNPNHVVLDSILREELCINEVDYKVFADHCSRIAKILDVTPVDVESGLFAFVQIMNPNQRKTTWKRYQ